MHCMRTIIQNSTRLGCCALLVDSFDISTTSLLIYNKRRLNRKIIIELTDQFKICTVVEQPLIYVLIGGGIKEIDYVKSALTKNHYVIIAMVSVLKVKI